LENETDKIVMGKCVNANSEPSGVKGKQEVNKGKATSTTTVRIGLGGEGGVKASIIAMREL
jgi:hypothetical protein